MVEATAVEGQVGSSSSSRRASGSSSSSKRARGVEAVVEGRDGTEGHICPNSTLSKYGRIQRISEKFQNTAEYRTKYNRPEEYSAMVLWSQGRAEDCLWRR